MAKVPTLDAPTVAPIDNTGVGYSNVTARPEDFGALQARAMEGLGNTLQKTGDELAQHAVHFADQQNTADARDRANQLNNAIIEKTFTGNDAYYNLRGKDAYDQAPTAIQNIDALRDQFGKDLSPDAQKKYLEYATNRVEKEKFAISNHAATQNRVYRDQTASAMLDGFQSNALNFYDQPQIAESYIRNGASQVQANMADKGASPETTQYETQKWVSGVRAGIISRTAVDDPVKARDMFLHYQDQLDGATQLTLAKQLKAPYEAVTAYNTVQSILGGQPTANKDLTQAVFQQESGGKQFNAAGEPLVSEKGAVGVAQLLPSTAKEVAALHSIPFDENRLYHDEAYNRKLGEVYLTDLKQRYNGNQTLALAAYNAGPGAVDRWRQTIGDPLKNQIDDATFAAKIPYAETRHYVNAINQSAPPTPGVKATSDDIEKHFPNYLNAVKSVAGGDLELQKKLEQEFHSQAAQIQQGDRLKQENAMQTIYAKMEDKDNPIKSVADLVKTPDGAEAFNNLKPTQQARVTAAIAKNVKGLDAEQVAEQTKTFNDLLGKCSDDPAACAKINLADYDLSAHQRNQLTKLKQSIPETLTSKALQEGKNVAFPILQQVGIVKLTGKDANDQKQPYYQFMGRYQQALVDFVDQNKRNPTAKEYTAITRDLLTTGREPGTSGWFSGDKEIRKFQSLAEGKGFYVPVPDKQKNAIAAMIKTKLGRTPSDQEINAYYTAYAHSQTMKAATDGQ